MRSKRLLPLALIAAMLLVGCAEEPEPVVEPEILTAAGMETYWRFELPLEDDEQLEQIYLLDENLYCITDRSFLYALNAATGNILWTHDLGEPYQTVFRPSHYDAMQLTDQPLTLAEITGDELLPTLEPFPAVIFNTLNRAFVFDRTSGQVYRDIDLTFGASAGNGTDGEYVYIGGTEGRVHAVRLASGTHTWAAPVGAAQVQAPAEAYDRWVYVGGQNETFYCFRPGRNEDVEWAQEGLVGNIVAPFHVDRRGCFVPTTGNRLYAFRPDGGDLLWDQTTGGPLMDPLQVGANSAFIYARGDAFHALNITNGQRRWEMPAGRTVLSIADGTVYLRTDANNLRLVDEIQGTALRTVPLSGLDLFARNATAPAIYAGSHDGRVYCIKVGEQPRLTPEILRRKPW